MQVVDRTGTLGTSRRSARTGAAGETRKELDELGEFTEEAVANVSELNPEDYEIDQYVKVGNTIYAVRRAVGGQYRNTPTAERPKIFVEIGDLS